MIDVSSKFSTLRRAKAEGRLCCESGTLETVKEGKVPKGDVLEVARSAGISAAKRTSDWITFCHPIPLDWIEVSVSVETDHISVISETKSTWKTGVEMEALTAATAALLNIYDMLKPLDDSLRIECIRLVEKSGGKSDYTDTLPEPLRVAVLVISDSTHEGAREDRSGKAIQEFLEDQPVEVAIYEVLPDDQELIRERLQELVDEKGMDLIFTSGGTGLGSKDVTPEATGAVIEREVTGIAEAARNYGRDRTPFAMLSRGICGIRGESLIVNLPGSTRGATESLQALFPGLLHAFPMLKDLGHDHS